MGQTPRWTLSWFNLHSGNVLRRAACHPNSTIETRGGGVVRGEDLKYSPVVSGGTISHVIPLVLEHRFVRPKWGWVFSPSGGKSLSTIGQAKLDRIIG